MEDANDLRNTSVLSQSYMKGLNRITGNRQSTFEEELKIREEVLESREQTWSWLFEKFSEISDDIELNIHTLRPDNESSGSHVSEIRIPIRKSRPQLQYWINTGNPPCLAMDAEESGDSDGTISISESESADFDETKSSASMIVNMKPSNSCELIATESSGSSVDTTNYILKNGNAGKKKGGDNRASNPLGNLDNNIVGRSINATKPKTLLSRSMESPKTSEIYERTSLLHKSMSGEVDQERNVRSRIYFDKSIGCKTDELLGKRLRNDDVKDSEVTLESKESGIGSLAVESTDKGERNEGEKSSSPSEEVIIPRSNTLKSLCRRRKLYTNNDSFFDIKSPAVKSVVQRNKSGRKSFHPALDPPSTYVRKKAAIGPRLLTMSGVRGRGRRSKICSVNRRSKNVSLLSKSRALGSTDASHGGESKPADSVERSNSLAEKEPDRSANVCADVAEKNEKVNSPGEESRPEISSLNLDTRTVKASESRSPVDASSSLSSNDASRIINEEVNAMLERGDVDVPKKNLVGSYSAVEDVKRSGRKHCNNDRGSLFEALGDSSSETKESRVQSMRHVKKNLYATDLKSSRDTDSPSVSNSRAMTKHDEDSISNASTILLPTSRRRAKGSKKLKKDFSDGWKNSAQFNPVVILHDFLDLKGCCGDLEKRNNEYLLRRENRNAKNLKSDEKEVSKIDSEGKDVENVKSEKSMSRKVPVKKRPKLESKAVSADKDRKIFFMTSAGFVTDDSHSSDERTSCLRTGKSDDDSRHRTTKGRNYSQEIEPDMKIQNEENSTITFTTTNHNRWESIFVLTSSDEEDLFKKLSNTSKSRSSRKKRPENDEKVKAFTSVLKNTTLYDSGAPKSTQTLQDCYKIVSSSSEDEEMTVKTVSNVTGPRRVTRKYSKRNKRKNSPESKLTMPSTEDECRDRSESVQNHNEKLKKQSPGVNRRSATKKSKQSPETRRDYLVPQSKVNSRSQADRKSRAEKVCTNSGKSAIVISRKTNDVDTVGEPEINDKENDPNELSENGKTPVDRVPGSQRKPVQDTSKTNSRFEGVKKADSVVDQRDIISMEKSRRYPKGMIRDTLRMIATAVESSDGEEKPEVWRVPNYKNRSKSSPNTEGERDDKLISDRRESCAVLRTFKMVFDDESSDNDDVLTLSSKNYAGDNSRDKRTRHEGKGGASRAISSNIHERGIEVKKAAPSSSKKNINDRRTTSKIVFRTKEYWESDSDG